jgi:hypothetical protein
VLVEEIEGETDNDIVLVTKQKKVMKDREGNEGEGNRSFDC